MVVTKLKPIRVNYGWVTEVARSNNLGNSPVPAGKIMVVTPREAIPNSKYIDKGLSGLNLNGGQPTTGIPFAWRGVCLGNTFLKDWANDNAGGKHLNQFSQSDCAAAVSSLLTARGGGYKYFTSQFYEAYGGDEPWKVVAGSQQDRWISEAITAFIAANGGHYYGDYDGHISSSRDANFMNSQTLRNALGNVALALEYAKSATPFGNAFYTQNMYQVRDGLSQFYLPGLADPGTWICSKMIDSQIDSMARQAVGSNRKVIAFCWFSEIQFAGFLQRYRHYLPQTGGYFEATFFSNFYFQTNLMMGLIGMIMLDGVFAWQVEARTGSNPEIIAGDYSIDGREHRYYGGGNPQRGSGQPLYDPAVQYAYPQQPMGYEDVVYVIKEWVADAFAWAGTNYTYARHKVGNGSYTTLASTYILDNYNAGKGWCLMGVQGNRRWILYVNTSLNMIGQWETVTVDLLGQTHTFEACGSFPVMHLIEI